MEKLKVTKVGKSKYGAYLLVDDGTEKGNFRSTTEQVTGFLSKQVPCELEVEEVEDKEDRKSVITRVKVLGSSPQTSQASQETFQKADQVSEPQPQLHSTQDVIRAEFCIRESLKSIEVNNALEGDGKIKPTRNEILQQAKIIDSIIDDLLK